MGECVSALGGRSGEEAGGAWVHEPVHLSLDGRPDEGHVVERHRRRADARRRGAPLGVVGRAAGVLDPGIDHVAFGDALPTRAVAVVQEAGDGETRAAAVGLDRREEVALTLAGRATAERAESTGGAPLGGGRPWAGPSLWLRSWLWRWVRGGGAQRCGRGGWADLCAETAEVGRAVDALEVERLRVTVGLRGHGTGVGERATPSQPHHPKSHPSRTRAPRRVAP